MTNQDPKDGDNQPRWDGERAGWYEVYFLKWNDLNSRTAGWIRYTMTRPTVRGEPGWCELWGIHFDVENPGDNFAVKRRYPIDRFSWERGRFEVRVDEHVLSSNACRGVIADESRGKSMSWDLKFGSDQPTVYMWPYMKMYEMAFPKTKMLSPHPDARFSGTLVAGGREIQLDATHGQQSHMWGTQSGHRWTWGHCNTFREEPGAVWEGLDAQIKLGPFTSPHLKLFYLRTGGEDHFFNAPLKLFTNRSAWKLGEWTFDVSNDKIRVVGEVTCLPDRFVGVTYTDTDGSEFYCHNTKVANMRLHLYRPDGKHIGELTTEDACAMEHVDREPYFLVPIRI